MTHLEQRLKNDLEKIRAKVAEQAVLVETALRNAVQAFQTGEHALAHTTVIHDHPINRNMRAIDRLCHSFIAVHLPSAGNLRLISAVIRVSIELERIGDYAVTIAREAVQLSTQPAGEIGRELERLAGEGLSPASSARKLSAIRQFHRFLCADGVRTDDPTRIVASPKARRGLPKVL
ncbi:MAG TPA: PhoU domain-containing protein, partial [Gammaproteobacteria bacterium]|nr:PhoU domain-containing protein [Gammaproteobacteria bacterium]